MFVSLDSHPDFMVFIYMSMATQQMAAFQQGLTSTLTKGHMVLLKMKSVMRVIWET
ncbi:hypothetical protein GW17_00049046 [Ensete ventricosum]|nr:hypothetical protein GW17_00049046 [Ensete ventricosum]